MAKRGPIFARRFLAPKSRRCEQPAKFNSHAGLWPHMATMFEGVQLITWAAAMRGRSHSRNTRVDPWMESSSRPFIGITVVAIRAIRIVFAATLSHDSSTLVD